MVIFNSYVSLPEGNIIQPVNTGIQTGQTIPPTGSKLGSKNMYNYVL